VAVTGGRPPRAQSGWIGRSAPSLDEFEAMAREALDSLPEPFRELVKDVSCTVAEFADDETLDELGIESEFDLLGLFRGVGRVQEGAVPSTGQLPNRIWLYRRPILDYWAEHEDTLGAVITHVLVHEMGHHFGFSDADMEAIEAAAAVEGPDEA
jgi:predicted Zn-dependent protease with MMP-like domain